MNLKALLVRRFRALALRGETKVKMPNFKKFHWRYPNQAEQEYYNYLVQKMKDFISQFSTALDRMAQSNFQDSAESEFEAIQAKMYTEQARMFSEGERGNFLGGIFNFGRRAATYNLIQFQEFLGLAIGQAFYDEETWLQPLLQQWADDNYTLIKSMTTNYIDRTNALVQKAVQAGTAYPEVIKQIRAIDESITYSKARLIARDQIGKLNGRLAEQRQVDAGIESYLWDTSGDERVRGNPSGRFPKAIPSHWIMDQVLCRWDDKNVMWEDSTGTWIPRAPRMPRAHPGEEIQCRCVGIPYMDEIWTSAANEAGLEATGVDIPPTKQGLSILANMPNVPGTDKKSYSGVVRDYVGSPPKALAPSLFSQHGKKSRASIQELYSGDDGFRVSDAKSLFLNFDPTMDIKTYLFRGRKIMMPGELKKLVAMKLKGMKTIPLRQINLDALIQEGVI